MMTTPYRTLIASLAVVLLACLMTACSDPKPPATLTKDSEACKIFHEYLEKQMTNLDGKFDLADELPKMLKRVEPYLPTKMQRDAKLGVRHLEKFRSLQGYPDRQEALSETKDGAASQAAVLSILVEINRTCGRIPGNSLKDTVPGG